MAMTAWSAKVLSSAICFSVNGRTSVRRITIAPIGDALAQQRVARYVREPTRLTGLASGILGCSSAEDHGYESFVGR